MVAGAGAQHIDLLNLTVLKLLYKLLCNLLAVLNDMFQNNRSLANIIIHIRCHYKIPKTLPTIPTIIMPQRIVVVLNPFCNNLYVPNVKASGIKPEMIPSKIS